MATTKKIQQQGLQAQQQYEASQKGTSGYINNQMNTAINQVENVLAQKYNNPQFNPNLGFNQYQNPNGNTVNNANLQAQYNKYVNEFYVLNYGYHLNEETATKWVSEMKSSDGVTGEHYSVDLAKMYARQNDIDFKESRYNFWDWYAILNMVYSDYHQVIGNNNDTYIKLAKATLEDYDVKDKAYKYYHCVVKGE